MIDQVDAPGAIAVVQRHAVWGKTTAYGAIFAVHLDRELARELLSYNAGFQRNKRSASVARYLEDMDAGQWVNVGDPIRLDTDGRLIDGQHRLTAIVTAKEDHVIADVPVQVLKAKDAYLALDQATVRRPIDLARATETPVPLTQGNIAAIAFEADNYRRSSRWTNRTKVDHALRCPFLRDLHIISSHGYRKSGFLAAALRCLHVDREEALKFFSSVAANRHVIDNEESAAARQLSTWLMKSPEARRHGDAANRVMSIRCLQHWNAHRQRADVGRLIPLAREVPEAV